MDNYIGWSLAEKQSLYRAAQERVATGQVVRLQTASGVYTEFAPTMTKANQILRDIEQSIVESPDFDPNDAFQAACLANQRPGYTTTEKW